MSKRLKNSVGVATRVQEIFPVHLLLVDDGHKKIGRDKQYCPAEIGRGYTDDRERMLAQPNSAAHHAGIILKVAVPICIAQHEIRSAVAAVLIGTVEETPQIRLRP